MRKYYRQIVKYAMDKMGLYQICKRTGKRGQGRSYFAEHWRDFSTKSV